MEWPCWFHFGTFCFCVSFCLERSSWGWNLLTEQTGLSLSNSKAQWMGLRSCSSSVFCSLNFSTKPQLPCPGYRSRAHTIKVLRLSKQEGLWHDLTPPSPCAFPVSLWVQLQSSQKLREEWGSMGLQATLLQCNSGTIPIAFEGSLVLNGQVGNIIALQKTHTSC